MNKKVLVAYFSASGVTKKLAENLSEILGADLHEIVPAQPYTSADIDWTNKKSRSTLEMQDKSSRPAVANKVQNIEQYDVIFVGFPIWWYVAPTIINTFLEEYNLSGKTVVPFATSGGSGMGRTNQFLSPSTEATLVEGKVFNRASQDEIKSWAEAYLK